MKNICNREYEFRGKLALCTLEPGHDGPHGIGYWPDSDFFIDDKPVRSELLYNDFDFDFFEEGEPETINDDSEFDPEIRKALEELDIPLSDWQPIVAPSVADTKAKGLCENCGEREGKWRWLGESDGSLAISHGWTQNYPWWCDVCCLKGKIDYATRLAAKIPEYEKEIAEILDGEV